jgi:hypothetical protein
MPVRLIEMGPARGAGRRIHLHLTVEDVLDRWRTELSDGRRATSSNRARPSASSTRCKSATPAEQAAGRAARSMGR